MPRAVTLLVVTLLAFTLGSPVTVGAPAAPSLVTGTGTATTFTIWGGGSAIENAGYDWTLVCGACGLLVTFTDSAIDVTPGPGTLPPGTYQIKEFRGVISHSQNAPGEFFFEIHGLGLVKRVA